MCQSTDRLRVSEDELSNSRKLFIQTLQNKKQFDADCAVIIPELDRVWEEKILLPFELTPAETTVINWRHYLYNYTPQILVRGIGRLARRMTMEQDGQLYNRRGPINNVAAYYKALVRDLQRQAAAKTTVPDLEISDGTESGTPAYPVDEDELRLEGTADEILARIFHSSI